MVKEANLTIEVKVYLIQGKQGGCHMTSEVVIVSAVRTAIGSFQGALKDVPATKLGAIVIEKRSEERRVGKECPV